MYTDSFSLVMVFFHIICSITDCSAINLLGGTVLRRFLFQSGTLAARLLVASACVSYRRLMTIE